MDRREETIDRKDIIKKLESINIQMIERFASAEAKLTIVGSEVTNVKEQLIKINSKVATHEQKFGEMAIRDAVQSQELTRIKIKQKERAIDGKKWSFFRLDKLITFLLYLAGTGLIALLTYFITS